MARKQRTNYYVMFVNLQNYSRQAADYLHTFFREFNADPVIMKRKMTELHEIEHHADIGKHELMKRLVADFITPIEREDIVELATKLDDITDSVEEVLRRLYMYNVKSLRPEAMDFLNIIQAQCDTVARVFSEFHDFKYSKTIHDDIIKVNSLEEDGDDLYLKSVRRLFEEENTSPIETLAWTAIFDQLEACCDSNEIAVNTLEEVMMKNS